MMGVLGPSARYRKGHYSYGKFTAPQPHGLHTDHSAEDPGGAGEPICIARIETLGTHYLAGDYKAYDPETQSMLKALRYWIAVPEGEPENILDELLKRETLKAIPVNRVMLMVAGNSSENSQITQHIAARPPDGGLHSTFFRGNTSSRKNIFVARFTEEPSRAAVRLSPNLPLPWLRGGGGRRAFPPSPATRASAS